MAPPCPTAPAKQLAAPFAAATSASRKYAAASVRDGSAWRFPTRPPHRAARSDAAVARRMKSMRMQRGDVIGDPFEIDEHVASGGMGRVFRARDLRSGEIVAVKVLIGDLRVFGARFDREGQTLARLSHPGIVRYVAHGIAASGQAYLAMEWLEGEDLASRLSRGRL